jgi:hypothetical protein
LEGHGSRPLAGGLDPWYVTGFCEGVSIFTYSRSGDTLNLVFAINRRPGEEHLLEAVRAFFGGAGKVYRHQFRVTRLAELASVIRHLDAYPLQGRARPVYELWREMVRLKRESFRKPPLERLEKLAEELKRAREPGPEAPRAS